MISGRGMRSKVFGALVLYLCISRSGKGFEIRIE